MKDVLPITYLKPSKRPENLCTYKLFLHMQVKVDCLEQAFLPGDKRPKTGKNQKVF